MDLMIETWDMYFYLQIEAGLNKNNDCQSPEKIASIMSTIDDSRLFILMHLVYCNAVENKKEMAANSREPRQSPGFFRKSGEAAPDAGPMEHAALRLSGPAH
jgi:hypothetical protein